MAKITNVRIVSTKYGTFSLHYTNPDGRRRRLSVGPDHQLVQRRSVKFTDWLLEGKDPEIEIQKARNNETAQAITVRELFPDFMSRHGTHKSTNMQISYRNSFKNICRCPEIADSPIGAVTLAMVLDYLHARMKQDKVTPATVNREGAFLRCLYARACEWGILDKNPLQWLKQIPESGKREVAITVDQAGKLVDQLPVPIANIVEFAIYSGFRRGNILGLKIEDLVFHDLQESSEALIVIKGGKRKRFLLGSHATDVLRRSIGNRKEGYVFLSPRTGTRYGSVHKAFDRAVRKLGLQVNGTKMRFHDLRHVFATWLSQCWCESG